MLVCNVSLRPPRAAIAATIAETTAAVDATATGNVIFAALVDDPASVNEIVDAYLGEIMLEAASAADDVDAHIPVAYDAAVVETATAADTQDASAAVLTVTFDSATATNVTLSNGDLTATHTNTTTGSGVRVASASAKTTGKYYFEVTTVAGHGSGDAIGIMATTTSYNNMTAANPDTYGEVLRNSGVILYSGSNSFKTLATFFPGDVCGVAVDLTARLIWYRRNGGNWNGLAIGSENPATGTGGVTITGTGAYVPAVAFGGGGTAASDAFTANFGATSFANAAPSGFGNWPI